VRALEDAPIFDAGVGSVLNRDGDVELDAAVMDGDTLRSGAVAAVRRIKNPITLARHVLASPAVLLVAQGAERFAEAAGLPLCDPAELIVERERRRWDELRTQERYQTQDAFGAARVDQEAGSQGDRQASSLAVSRSADLPLKHPGDTVGCVALDRHGNLAAGTSTGGTSHKLPGRVGDSPLLGSGLYADNATGGCSTTGWGESIMKVLLAKTATDLIGAENDPMSAARAAIGVLHRRVGGLGGCILLDTQGRIGFAFNTPRMAYAYRTEDVGPVVGI